MTSLRPRAVMVILMAVTLFVFAFPVVLADFGPGPLFYYRLLLFPADLALAATTIFVFWVAVSQRVRPGPATMLLGAFTVSLAVAWLVHPSPQGVQIVARFVGATSLALGFSILRRDERVLAVGTLTVVTGIQLAVAVAQMLGHGPLGLPSFGEIADPLLNYGGIFAPRGTMHAMYVLAGLALVTVFLIVREGLGARTRIAVFITAGILAAIVGLTMSRAAALGLVVSCGALLLGVRAHRRSLFQASAALASGAFVAALICLPGWTLKAATGLSGREIEVDQSTSLIPGSFLIGIGPGRSYAVLEQRYPGLPWYDYQPAHSLPVLATVEAGVVAGALAVALLLTLAWRARADVRALALFFAFLPLVLTDQFPYDFLQGVILLGVWVGALDGMSARPAEAIAVDWTLIPGSRLLPGRFRRPLPQTP